MSKKRKRKLNNSQAEVYNGKTDLKNNRHKPDDYDYKNAVYPDNSSLKVPPEGNETASLEGDAVLRKIGKDAVVGEYNFINVAVVFILIMIMGISFALLRNNGEYIENNNKISTETVLNGKFTKKLSKNYMKRLPGKQLLFDANRVFSYAYGLAGYNDEKGFVSVDTGKIIGIKTYDEPIMVTITTTAPPTTTQYTGKTTNTTRKLKGSLFVGPGQLTTTAKTKKTTTKKTTTKTTSASTPTTTVFKGTTWSFRGTTTWKTTTVKTSAHTTEPPTIYTPPQATTANTTIGFEDEEQ